MAAPRLRSYLVATNGKVGFRPADATTLPSGAIGGWDQVKARLKGDADGNPMLVMLSDLHRHHPHDARPTARTGSAGRPRHQRRGPRRGRCAVWLHVVDKIAAQRQANKGFSPVSLRSMKYWKSTSAHSAT